MLIKKTLTNHPGKLLCFFLFVRFLKIGDPTKAYIKSATKLNKDITFLFGIM